MSSFQPYQPPQPGPYAPQPGPYPPQAGQQPQMYGVPPVPVSQPYPTMAYPSITGEHPNATAILILGILGFVTSGVTGIIAWIMGNSAKKECAAGMYTATDSLKVGRMLGKVTGILLIVGVAVCVVALIIGLVVTAGSGS